MPVSVDLKRVIEIAELTLGVSQISQQDRILEDLGAESADVVNLVARLESHFDVHIPEERLPELRTIADLHAELIRLTLEGDDAANPSA